MARIIIKKRDLPVPDATSQKYYIKYRLATESKNSLSYWSPIFDIDMNAYRSTTSYESYGNTSISSNTVAVTWEPIPGISSYDVFVKQGTSEASATWSFLNTIDSNTITFIKDHSVYKIKIYVHALDQDQGSLTAAAVEFDDENPTLAKSDKFLVYVYVP